EIDISFVSYIYARQLTHTSEHSFILYIGSEYTLCVYDILIEQGKDYEIINAGSDCSQLIVEYPEFYTYPEAELCVTYGFSLKLGKLVVILSILYNAYLLYRLFDLPPLPLIVSGVTLTFLFYITFTNNEWTLQALESILILLGFIMISGHNLFLNIDEHMKKE
ncbi:unnamed protein product, partial [Rotaria sordida]